MKPPHSQTLSSVREENIRTQYARNTLVFSSRVRTHNKVLELIHNREPRSSLHSEFAAVYIRI